jgi:hypothetical protein
LWQSRVAATIATQAPDCSPKTIRALGKDGETALQIKIREVAEVMLTRRLLIGLAAIASIMCFSAAPAMAEWAALEEGASEGFATSSAVTVEGSGGAIECKGTAGGWKLPGGEGTKLTSTVKLWSGCKGKSKEFKEIEFTVNECSLGLGSPAGPAGLKVTGSIAKGCVATAKILFLTCEVKLPASKANEGLQEGTAADEEFGESYASVVTAEYGGITDEVSKACPGFTSSSTVKVKTKITEEALQVTAGRFVKTSGAYPVLESSAPAAQTFVFKNSTNQPVETVECPLAVFEGFIPPTGPIDYLLVEPKFSTAPAICKEGGVERVTIEIKGCAFTLDGVNPPVTGNYPAILMMRNTTTVCELTFKNGTSMCIRRMKAQARQTVTLKNLAGELEVKLTVTNMEDETQNASCPGNRAGLVSQLDELKGGFKMPRVNVMT